MKVFAILFVGAIAAPVVGALTLNPLVVCAIAGVVMILAVVFAIFKP